MKTLVCGVKTITWGCTSVKSGQDSANSQLVGQAKQFSPKETLVYIRLVKYAMEALDIYTLNATPPGVAVAGQTSAANAGTSASSSGMSSLKSSY